MKRSYKYLCLAAGVALFATSCKEKEKEVFVTEYVDSSLDVPTKYEFDSRFDAGVSSVSHGGQTVRNMLIQDIKAIISNEAAATTPSSIKASVLELYNYADNNKTTLTEAGSFSLLVDVYENISAGKSLSGKIDGDVVIGSSQTADALIDAWLDEIDANIADGKTGSAIYINSDSVDLNQMINKVLTGAVTYSQGVGKYLNNIVGEDNLERKGGTAVYTVAEHVWDEAFGYFGAAIDYNDFTDVELAGGTIYKDANGDNQIDFTTEYNFGLSVNGGKRDNIFSTTDVDPYLRRDAYNAFLAGRAALANQRGTEEIRIYARQAAEAWEKIIAATAIHYINDVNADLQARIDGTVTSDDQYDYAKHWSELKGFLISLQYGSADYQLISTNDLTAIHTEVGEKPEVVDFAAYQTKLTNVANDLRLIYNFDATNVSSWRLR